MKKKSPPKTLEQLYPNSRARAEAWKAVDAMSVTETIAAALDKFDQSYVDAGGKSPFRQS